jgi:apolipoprotein N-acyltransferase
MWAMSPKLLQNKWAVSVIAGVLTFLAFPCFEIVPLIFIAPIFINLAALKCESPKQALGFGFLLSTVVMLGGFYWITYVLHEFGYLPWIISGLLFFAFCSFGALNFPLYFLLVQWINKKMPLEKLKSPCRELAYSLMLPTLFSLVEFFIPKLFPWYFGHSLYRQIWLIQPVELTGSLVLTFFVFTVGSSLGALAKTPKKPLPLSCLLTPALGLFLFMVVFSHLRINEVHDVRPFKIAMVQPSINSQEKEAARLGYVEKVRKVLDRFKVLTESVLSQKPELMVWPETSLPFLMDSPQNGFAQETKANVLKWQIPVIAGSYSHGYPEPDRDYNTAYLIEPQSTTDVKLSLYPKNILLAYGEYLPLGDTFPVLYQWFPQVANFGKGKEQNPFILKDGTRVGITICYEAIVPSFFRKGLLHNVDFAVNITNDSWFGPTSEPYLHGSLTIFRAIEGRVPFIRTTNTGTSFVVDAFGRLSEQTPINESSAKVYDIAIRKNKALTFYVKHGDWFVLFLSLLFLSLSLLFRRQQCIRT